MTVQLTRSIIYLATNTAATTAWVMVAWSQTTYPDWYPDDRAWWAGLILGYIGGQIGLRILINIFLALVNAARRSREKIDQEDEYDRLVDYRVIQVGSGIFMIAFLAGLATQLAGQGLPLFFVITATGLATGGLASDLVCVANYLRGYRDV